MATATAKPKAPTRTELLDTIRQLEEDNEWLGRERDMLVDLEHEYWGQGKHEHAAAIREALRRLDEGEY